MGEKSLDNLTEEILEKCVAGRNISAEEKLKEKEKRIRDLEKLVAMQEEMLKMVKGTNLVGKSRY